MDFKRYRPVFCIFLFMLLLCCLITAAAENLLDNPDFLELDEEDLPVDWYTDAYILEPGYTIFTHSEGDPEHPMAVVIQNIGENDARFAQTVEVEPESLYLLSGYVKAENVEGGHGANLSVEGIYAFSEKYYDTDGQWQYIEYYGETGPDQDYLTVFARLGGYSGVSTGKAYFADLSLKKVDSIPGDGIADLWYKEDSYIVQDEEETDDVSFSSGIFRPWMIFIGSVYGFLALFVIFQCHKKQFQGPEGLSVKPVYTGAVLLSALLLRLVICWLVEGYMVDVNCFLSWGNTMATVGPARFYEATSFCDYPPLYTYILALNSFFSRIIGNGTEIARIVFRFIPCVCDLIGCWILYRILIRQKDLKPYSCFFFLAFFALNPATILNSAAWGQMDSVLCLLLLSVAIFAVNGKWTAALPLYVVSVLVKPQALMLGPLGLIYILITWVKAPGTRKNILYGTGISLITLAAGVIPFSLNQNWDWIIQLYSRTLASYPYATVNTANMYYLLGGNWAAVCREAHALAPVILCIFCAAYSALWYFSGKEDKYRIIETVLSLLFAFGFVLAACLKASWAWTGGLAMCFAFLIIISQAVRSGNIRLLPWLGGLLYILLYVFGVKMHERYVFPAILLLGYAWVLLKDRRILYVLLLFTFTLFINEGIILDNSIRLGSQMGHLNNDTVWLADILSLLNITGSLYAVWLSIQLFHSEQVKPAREGRPADLSEWKADRKLHWSSRDTLLLSLITLIYSVICLLTLGSSRAPQNAWSSSSSDEQIVLDLGESINNFEILYFAQVSRNDFSISVSEDGLQWEEETWAQMDQGQCWKWKYVTISYENGNGNRTYYNSDESHIVRFSGRYIRISAHQLGLKLNEILIRNDEGIILPVLSISQLNAEPESELYSDPSALTDEQDTFENLPAIFGNEETRNSKVQPSWWNSTYFDEIYHARTAYEFLQGTVPYETSHPPLGKVLMSFCVAIFGMTPFGWRFAGALAGILMLPGMYLLGKQLTKKTWIGVTACLLMAFDCMHLTQTQIATIDSFPVLFIIFAYFFMLRFMQTDTAREKIHVPLVSLGLSGLFMGLSIASKWIGIYAGAGLAVLFFWHCARMIRRQKTNLIAHQNTDIPTIEKDPDTDRIQEKSCVYDAVNRTIVFCGWCILFFIVIPVIIYLLSYIPYLAFNAKRIHSVWDYISEVWRSQIGMFNYHSTPNLGMDHPFYSPWWEWPIIGKPMYYASQQYLEPDYPVHHSIFSFGNPVIWYGALAAVAICIIRRVLSRRYSLSENGYNWHIRSKDGGILYGFILIGLLAQYLPWVLVPRGTYIYHYFASLPFLMLSLCLCFSDYSQSTHEKAGKALAAIFLAASAAFFILLFPYASGMNVSAGWLNIGKHLLKIWY